MKMKACINGYKLLADRNEKRLDNIRDVRFKFHVQMISVALGGVLYEDNNPKLLLHFTHNHHQIWDALSFCYATDAHVHRSCLI